MSAKIIYINQPSIIQRRLVVMKKQLESYLVWHKALSAMEPHLLTASKVNPYPFCTAINTLMCKVKSADNMVKDTQEIIKRLENNDPCDEMCWE